MKLQTVRAVYRDGGLIFADPSQTPEDGEEVVVTFLEKDEQQAWLERDPIQALRGRGRGENLVEQLLESRHQDRHHNEQDPRIL